MIIAIDGPAASGKGTLARRLAAHFGLKHLDTGLLYRAVGLALLNEAHPLDSEELAEAAARSLDPDSFDKEALRAPAAGEAASLVAAMPPVRAALLDLQRRFAEGGAVLDGRDIGTVVLPDADVKLFVTASPEARARRRHAEDVLRDAGLAYDDVLTDIRRRDARDSGRAVAPMAAAPDAHLLDTTDMDIEAAFRAALDIVEAVRPR